MGGRRAIRLAAAIVAAWCALPCASAQEKASKEGTEFQLFIENDLWARTDRFYTNGLKLGVGVPSSFLTKFLEGPAKSFLNTLEIKLQGDRESDQQATPHFGVFIGQNMYTPRRISVAAPQPLDRPWAAWSYLGVLGQREIDNRLDSAEIDIGMVGAASGGEWVQTEWHKLIGSPKPLGWDNQIPNEVAFMGSYLHKRRLDREQLSFLPRNVEIIPHAGVSLGTVMTLARAGGMLRIGRNMTGFGPDTIEPGGAMLQNTRHRASGANRENLEWYGFLGVDHRLVAQNIFLDGTVFHKSASVDRRVHVYDVSWGLSAHYNLLRVSLTRVHRSEEFTTPLGGGGKQNFDSINIGFEF